MTLCLIVTKTRCKTLPCGGVEVVEVVWRVWSDGITMGVYAGRYVYINDLNMDAIRHIIVRQCKLL